MQTQQLENTIAQARSALEAGQQKVNTARTAHTEASESHTRAVSAMNANTDDSDASIGELTSAVGKALARRNQAALRMAQVEREVGLPALQAAVTAAERALADFIADEQRGAFAHQREADRAELVLLLNKATEILARLKAAATTSATAMNLTHPAILAMLGITDAVRDVDLSLLTELATAVKPAELAFRLFGEPVQFTEFAKDESEIVQLALAGQNPAAVLGARRSQKLGEATAARRTASEQQCAALAKAVSDEISALGQSTTGVMSGGLSPEQLSDRVNDAKLTRVRLREGQSLDEFEFKWSTETAGKRGQPIRAYSSPLTRRYDELRSMLEGEAQREATRLQSNAIATRTRGAPHKNIIGAPRLVGTATL